MSTLLAHRVVETTCQVWTGTVNVNGYGMVISNGRRQMAHRLAWEAANGPIPEGAEIDHLCRVRNCVRLTHLEVVTPGQNTRRGARARWLAVGDECLNGHLMREEADMYRRPSGRPECRQCRADSRHQTGAYSPSLRRRPWHPEANP